MKMKNVFIIGSKGIPANYGGFETFVHKLTQYKKSSEIQYHVSCLSDKNDEFTFNGARCFNVSVPNIGPAKAVIYDVLALKQVIKYVKDNDIKDSIVYILACRIGPFLKFYEKKLKKHGIKILINPDGHEWMRSKWNYFIKKYWKLSEGMMIKSGDKIVCDSKGIESYIRKEYSKYNPDTTFIAYGADNESIEMSSDNIKELNNWYKKNEIREKEYYLIVGRFVPENNYETMIKEFMKSDSTKDLVIISNVEENKFYNYLKEATNFSKDKRIKFVGTVYDEAMLRQIREKAYGYFHGHEVGGTNPSLLEALATTNLNILLDVVFNKEVAQDTAEYFSKAEGNLSKLIDRLDNIDSEYIDKLGLKAKENIKNRYSWDLIINLYESLFLE
jgi:Glycosyltransferase